MGGKTTSGETLQLDIQFSGFFCFSITSLYLALRSEILLGWFSAPKGWLMQHASTPGSTETCWFFCNESHVISPCLHSLRILHQSKCDDDERWQNLATKVIWCKLGKNPKGFKMLLMLGFFDVLIFKHIHPLDAISHLKSTHTDMERSNCHTPIINIWKAFIK